MSNALETVGICMVFLGMGGMDTEGNMWYLALAFMILGAFLTYLGDRISRAYKRRRWEYDGSRTIPKRKHKNGKRTML